MEPSEISLHDQLRKSPETARLQQMTELVSDASNLLHALSSNRQPDYSEHTFEFPVSLTNNVELPAFMRRRQGKQILKGVTVTLGSDGGDASHLGIEVEDTGIRLYISRLGHDQIEEIEDVVIAESADGAFSTLDATKISRAEINRLLASLAWPDEDSNYAVFDAINFQKPKVYEDLVDTLEGHAAGVRSVFTYKLSGGAELSGTTENVELTTATVSVPSAREGRIIRSYIDAQRGVDVTFAIIEDEEKRTFIPDLTDLIALRELLQTNINLNNPVSEILGDLDVIADDDANPETIVGEQFN